MFNFQAGVQDAAHARAPAQMAECSAETQCTLKDKKGVVWCWLRRPPAAGGLGLRVAIGAARSRVGDMHHAGQAHSSKQAHSITRRFRVSEFTGGFPLGSNPTSVNRVFHPGHYAPVSSVE